MRFRFVLVPLGLALLACTGTLPTGGDDEARTERPRKGRKSKSPDGPEIPGIEVPDVGDDDGSGGDGDAGDGGGGGGGAKPSPSPSPAPSAPPEGIEQVNSTTWTVSQEKKDAILANPGKFAGASKKGRGYALKGIATGSDAWHMGLRNGDIVKEVNGYSLASDAEAIAAYSQLQDAKKLRVKLKRGDGPLNHTYNIE